jgi:hypothetical protein
LLYRYDKHVVELKGGVHISDKADQQISEVTQSLSQIVVLSKSFAPFLIYFALA